MMKMQGNTTEIDERNLLRLDALLSHGYGLSPQLVMRSKGLSIEAKALYGYLSSFAGAGDTAFPSTSRILEELDISKNRFYKIRNSHLKANFTAKKIFQKTNGFAQWATIRQSLTMSYCVENLKQGRKPELTIFTSKKRTFPQAFSVRKSVVQAVEKFLQKEKLYVKRDTNVPFSARPEKKALRTAKVQ